MLYSEDVCCSYIELPPLDTVAFNLAQLTYIKSACTPMARTV